MLSTERFAAIFPFRKWTVEQHLLHKRLSTGYQLKLIMGFALEIYIANFDMRRIAHNIYLCRRYRYEAQIMQQNLFCELSSGLKRKADGICPCAVLCEFSNLHLLEESATLFLTWLLHLHV